nr:ABC transporter substrate binding protein [Ancylobacter crimeensis]
MHRRQLLGAGAAGLGGAVLGRLRLARAAEGFRILMVTRGPDTDIERGFRDYLASENVPAAISALRLDLGASDASSTPGTSAPSLRTRVEAMTPDLVYTASSPPTLAVVGPYDAPDPQAYVRDRPVVFANITFPIQARIVPSLEHPGGNVTGAISLVPTDIQLRAMQSYRPFTTLGVLHSDGRGETLAMIAEVKAWCERARITVVERVIPLGADGRPEAGNVAGFVGEMAQAGAQWLYLAPEPFFETVYHDANQAALAHGIPVFGSSEEAVRFGALAGLVARGYSIGQLAASKAVQILVEKVPPGTIAVQPLKRFSLTINITVAKKLGIYPPIEMLNYAEIIA